MPVRISRRTVFKAIKKMDAVNAFFWYLDSFKGAKNPCMMIHIILSVLPKFTVTRVEKQLLASRIVHY